MKPEEWVLEGILSPLFDVQPPHHCQKHFNSPVFEPFLTSSTRVSFDAGGGTLLLASQKLDISAGRSGMIAEWNLPALSQAVSPNLATSSLGAA